MATYFTIHIETVQTFTFDPVKFKAYTGLEPTQTNMREYALGSRGCSIDEFEDHGIWSGAPMTTHVTVEKEEVEAVAPTRIRRGRGSH